MPRAPFQILIFPFHQANSCIEYAIFKRSDAGYWQGIAGGGEDDETPLEAARREANEEAGIPVGAQFIKLDSRNTVPVLELADHLRWGPDTLVVPEYCFGTHVLSTQLEVSREHSEFKWVPYSLARSMLKWDSNRNALWELDFRLKNGLSSGSSCT